MLSIELCMLHTVSVNSSDELCAGRDEI